MDKQLTKMPNFHDNDNFPADLEKNGDFLKKNKKGKANPNDGGPKRKEREIRGNGKKNKSSGRLDKRS